MSDKMFLTIDNMEVQIEGERNLLEVVRKANIASSYLLLSF